VKEEVEEEEVAARVYRSLNKCAFSCAAPSPPPPPPPTAVACVLPPNKYAFPDAPCTVTTCPNLDEGVVEPAVTLW
jgi:hypothetical protein